MSADTVKVGQVVTIHFTMRNSTGEVIEDTHAGAPLSYLHGAGGIPVGLEGGLEGQRAGDRLSLQLDAAEAYGEPESEVLVLSRADFPEDMHLEAGVAFVAELSEGELTTMWVHGVDDQTITVSSDHPLAGEGLSFDVEVIGVRAASDEELHHGHVHVDDGCPGL